MESIDVKDLEHGAVYRIQSRNLVVGVYNEPAKGFIGVRYKFDSVYLFTEYDWSNGPPFGTVRALVRLAGPQGFELDEHNQELFDYLKILDNAIREQLAEQDRLDEIERLAWIDAHPHADEAKRWRSQAHLRRSAKRHGFHPSHLQRWDHNRTKHARDMMRYHEKRAVEEFRRVSDLRRGDPPA